MFDEDTILKKKNLSSGEIYWNFTGELVQYMGFKNMGGDEWKKDWVTVTWD